MTNTTSPARRMIAIARAEALFASTLPIGCRLTRRQADAAIAAEVHRRSGVRGCAAEMAAAYGERPESAAARMRWALSAVALAYATPPAPWPAVPQHLTGPVAA